MDSMITIKQIPQRNIGAKGIGGSGSTLILDGVEYDLSLLPDGATAEWSPEDSQIIKLERTGEDYLASVLVWFDPIAEEYDPAFSDEEIIL